MPTSTGDPAGDVDSPEPTPEPTGADQPYLAADQPALVRGPRGGNSWRSIPPGVSLAAGPTVDYD
ncbi:MAG TPA: hypothetical protein VHW44_11380 [Pseudonocardiaceae bacterium]|jgi:hypothetical protein|nr:hypothetical protein [Pseudonocardiaceae bacterium]